MPNNLVTDLFKANIKGAIAKAYGFDGIEHKTTKGRLREIVVTEMIRPLLPSFWNVTTGILCSSDGSSSFEDEDLSNTDSSSGQEDIIIYDSTLLPPFFSELEQSVVPVEAAISVVEVKSIFDSKELKTSISHAKRIYNLKKLWVYKEDRKGHNDVWMSPRYNIFSLNSDLKETGGRTTESERLIKAQKSECFEFPVVDTLCIAGRGTLFHPPINKDFQYLEVDAGEYEEILYWLITVVDLARITHRRRVENMKSLRLISYFHEEQ